MDLSSNEDTNLVHRRGVCTLAVMPRLDEQDAEWCILRIQLNGLEIWKHSCSLCTESIISASWGVLLLFRFPIPFYLTALGDESALTRSISVSQTSS